MYWVNVTSYEQEQSVIPKLSFLGLFFYTGTKESSRLIRYHETLLTLKTNTWWNISCEVENWTGDWLKICYNNYGYKSHPKLVSEQIISFVSILKVFRHQEYDNDMFEQFEQSLRNGDNTSKP